MKKLFVAFTCLSILINVQGQDFRTAFFKGGWVENAGYKGFAFPEDTFNVLDYGASDDGIFICTESFQKAVDRCFEAGGGVVFVPSGKYLLGSIFIKSNVHLFFDDGVFVFGSSDLKDYPEMETRVAGITMTWPVALINVNDAKNVKISGKADINGRGRTFWAQFHYMKPVYEENNLRWAVDYDCKRPRMVIINNSENVHVADLTLRESPFWTVHILYSKKVTVDGVTIRNKMDVHAPSSDGIDTDSSEDVLIQNCDVSCNDDNFCLKSGRDADGLKINRPCRYVVLRNNVTEAGAGLVVFGSETSGGINHIYIENMRANRTSRGIRFKSARTRGGTISNILIENVEITNTPFIFEFTMDWNPEYSYCSLPDKYNYDSVPGHWKTLLEPVDPEKGICKLQDVMLSNIKVSGKCWKAFNVEGYEEAPIKNFVFENVNLHTETAGEIKHADNWKSVNSSFFYDDKKPPVMINCTNMDPFIK